MFPERRLRRLRQNPALRRLVSETQLRPSDLVAPLFVREGIDEPRPIKSLPGVVQHTVTSLIKEAHELADLGVPAVMVFGITDSKDETGSEAWNSEGIAQIALTELRSAFDDRLVVMSDLCLDEYTSHGHCGVLDAGGGVDNDATLELYGRVAVAQANAGAHLVAPSGMMDGQVAVIRGALDEEAFESTGILAYSAKFASALYGPFRDAVEVSIADGGDRKAYQQDPANKREAKAEVALDVAEGADIVMIKPALSYLDVIADISQSVDLPVAAYHVSGEYAMVKAAAQNGWIDGDAVMFEQITSIKRAGADMVLTYAAKDLARTINAAS